MAWHPDFEAAFHPRAVAVIGASETKSSRFQGNAFIRNFQKLGFSGRIYPVNPKAEEILGLKAYPTLASVPEPVDLVIVSTPAREVPAVLEDCIAAGVKNVHVFTAGFSESGEEEGRQLENRLKEIAVKGGLHLVGPNGMGINVPAARMLTLYGESIKSGPVAFLSQSGGHAGQFTRYAQSFGIGFSKIISYGNGTVMDATDFLEYLATDTETRIIALYLEGVREGSKLLKQIKEINRIKPVIIWKGGLTEYGARAAASHTGSLAGREAIWKAFFKQTGAVQVNSLEELTDVTMTFLYLPPPSGRRVVLFMGGGGHSVTSADFCAREGLEVPTLSPETRRALRGFIPVAGTSVRNPIDAELLLRDLDSFEKALELVIADPEIDILIVDHHLDILQETGANAIREMGELMCRFAQQGVVRKPLVTVLESLGGDLVVNSERTRLQREFLQVGIGVYRNLTRASRALARYSQYHEFLRTNS